MAMLYMILMYGRNKKKSKENYNSTAFLFISQSNTLDIIRGYSQYQHFPNKPYDEVGGINSHHSLIKNVGPDYGTACFFTAVSYNAK